MSLGIGAFAHLAAQDDKIVLYEYGDYNLNISSYRNENHICDGLISIRKQCFIEPEIHKKLKKFPGSRKKIVCKKVIKSVDYIKFVDEGFITIENCSTCWEASNTDEHIDMMALRLANKILIKYQEEGIIPDSAFINM